MEYYGPISLTFRTSNKGDKNFLSKDTRLHLAFSSSDSHEVIVWKNIIFSSGTSQSDTPRYSAAKVGICVMQVEVDGTLSGGQETEVRPGDKWRVTYNNHAYHWSRDATNSTEKDDSGQLVIKCVNNAGHLLDLAVGVYSPKEEFEPVLLYKKVA